MGTISRDFMLVQSTEWWTYINEKLDNYKEDYIRKLCRTDSITDVARLQGKIETINTVKSILNVKSEDNEED